MLAPKHSVLLTNLQSSEQVLESAMSSRRKLEQEINALKRTLADRRRELDTKQTELNQLITQLEELQGRSAELDRSLSQNSDSIATKREQVKVARFELDETLISSATKLLNQVKTLEMNLPQDRITKDCLKLFESMDDEYRVIDKMFDMIGLSCAVCCDPIEVMTALDDPQVIVEDEIDLAAQPMQD